MPNYNPYQARQARKRKRKPGTLQDLITVLWNALLDAQQVLDECAGDPEQTLKAVHCVSQCAGQYAKLLEVGEFEARIAALEAAQKGR
jgi:hypothetical protein